ncbi:hypothetical protein [Tropicimonas sp. IMCC34011]|uniref:hypothetical protein n=1 Tax=Tropicimonas sp. IMCC34011 TaxID=2248759 RepID=UPI000E24B37E|nr:hypothetical protein [Tropicimonas sp. IMCC34011]
MSDLAKRLRHAMATMMNDDYSRNNTEERRRFLDRFQAMEKAADHIEALEAENARLRTDALKLWETAASVSMAAEHGLDTSFSDYDEEALRRALDFLSAVMTRETYAILSPQEGG